MISPRRAPVRPRVVLAATNESVLLEQVISDCLEQSGCDVLELVGGARSGKTTALCHLASLPIADRLLLRDEACASDYTRQKGVLTVCATRRPKRLADISYQLAKWCDDDVIEYLLSTHPDACGSVMERFSADPDRGRLSHAPALLAAVADALVRDLQIRDIRTALRQAVAAEANTDQLLEQVRKFAAAVIVMDSQDAFSQGYLMERLDAGMKLLDLLDSRWVLVLLTADQLIADLRKMRQLSSLLNVPLDVVQETALLAERDEAVLARLLELVNFGRQIYVSGAASILHAAAPDWRPDRYRSPRLAGAIFTAAHWNRIDLHRVNLEEADFAGSQLAEANFQRARICDANFRGCDMKKARLSGVRAERADFRDASMSEAELEAGRFAEAKFAGANLDLVRAAKADFRAADLRGASLVSAQLINCCFVDALLEEADFRSADLRGADLSQQPLRRAHLAGANFAGADLVNCDLEYVNLPVACFCDANLSGALLTGSTIFGADFRHALLRNTGLADIDWEGADLRGADLRGSSFHMGSTRSGLVGSPYPCHGSRTGFYTDDYDDQTYRAPEEIRKANLAGADLRGARVEDVDFYLVDLRGALYDATQAEHFRRCDAILFSRTP